MGVRLVHSSLSLPVCRNICVSCNLLLLKTWLQWMLSIVRDLWITSRILSTVSMGGNRLSTIFLSWRNTWRIRMVLRYIRNRWCFCPVCWLTSLVVSPMPCVKRWVKSYVTNWITWNLSSLKADVRMDMIRKYLKRFGETGKSLHPMLLTSLMLLAIHG